MRRNNHADSKCLLFDLGMGSFEELAIAAKRQDEVGNTQIFGKLEKDFDGGIELKPTEEGFRPITGEAGRREKKKDPLTIIIDKINKAYGTNFTEMDKVLLQIENDYAAESRWQSYAHNNDRKTFMLLFEKDFPEMAAQRYEQNEDFFVRLFSEPDMMKQIMETIGGVLYERLKKVPKKESE